MAKTTPLATRLGYTAPIPNLDGTPILNEKGEPLTLKDMITISCSANLPGDDTLDMVAKFKVGEIAATAHKGLPLTSEQIVTVKERSAKAITSPLMVYTFHQILEGHEV